MSDVTPEQRAELRKIAEAAGEFLVERNLPWHGSPGLERGDETFGEPEADHVATFDPLTVLALLDALDAAEARVAAAEREALERAVQAIEAHLSTCDHLMTSNERKGHRDAASIVRGLMPRKDGETP